MGFLSFFKKGDSDAGKIVVPSEEQQRKDAVFFVDAFLDTLYSDFDKEGTDDYDCARFRIAGITNYCTKKDIGLISGLSFPQNNPYDKNAIALGRIKGNSVSGIFGYIAKADQKEFNIFAGDNKQLPFLGYIRPFTTEDGHSGIMGLVKLYKGNCSKMYNRMIKDTQLLQGAFKGYYLDATLEEQGEKLEWVLDRHF